MDFGEALAAMREGKLVCRPGWTGPEGCSGIPRCGIELPGDDRFEPMLVVTYPGLPLARAFAGTQWDLLATDWELAGD